MRTPHVHATAVSWKWLPEWRMDQLAVIVGALAFTKSVEMLACYLYDWTRLGPLTYWSRAESSCNKTRAWPLKRVIVRISNSFDSRSEMNSET